MADKEVMFPWVMDDNLRPRYWEDMARGRVEVSIGDREVKGDTNLRYMKVLYDGDQWPYGFIDPIPSGWECPRCKTIMAPHTPTCPKCPSTPR